MLSKSADLVNQRCGAIGHNGSPDQREPHPLSSRLFRQRAHHRDAGHVEQDEDQIAVGRERAAEHRLHNAHRALAHLAVSFARFDRVEQRLRAERLLQVLPGFIQRRGENRRQALRWLGVRRILRLRQVERVQGADHALFRHGAGHQPHRRLPVVGPNAHRRKQRRQVAAGGSQYRVVDALRLMAAGRQAGKQADRHAGRDDHHAGTDNEGVQTKPGLQQQAAHYRHMPQRQLHDRTGRSALQQGML